MKDYASQPFTQGGISWKQNLGLRLMAWNNQEHNIWLNKLSFFTEKLFVTLRLIWMSASLLRNFSKKKNPSAGSHITQFFNDDTQE